jgi:hypothetical protein
LRIVQWPVGHLRLQQRVEASERHLRP